MKKFCTAEILRGLRQNMQATMTTKVTFSGFLAGSLAASCVGNIGRTFLVPIKLVANCEESSFSSSYVQQDYAQSPKLDAHLQWSTILPVVQKNHCTCQWQTAQVKNKLSFLSHLEAQYNYIYISIIMLSKLDALISNILRPLNTDQTFMFTFPTCERPNLTAKNISYRIVPCNCHSPNKGPPPNFDSSVVCEAQAPAQLCGYPGKTWLHCIWCAIVESVFCQYTVRSHVFTSGPCDMSTNDSK